MECPRCHHPIVPGVLFCPECEAPLKVIWEETNPMGSAVWEYGGKNEPENSEAEQLSSHEQGEVGQEQKLSLPVSRGLKSRR